MSEIPTTVVAMRKMDQLVVNPENPRSIKSENYERLKKQIQMLGMYKPVIIDQNNKVLGGNMRVRVYKEMGIEDIWVSVVDTKQGELETAYILSDNDSLGDWEIDDLAEMVSNTIGLDLEMFTVDTFNSTDLKKFLENISGIGEDESKEELKEKKEDEEIECPRCHLKFKK